MFRFANPQYLWLLLAVPALVALYWLAARNRRRRLARFGRPGILEELMPEVSTGRTAFRFILFCAAVALVILAAARPQFGSKLREEKAQGIEMMLTVDVSNSMLAEDFEPNRLERTKYAIGKLFEGLQQDRVGLVVFAGEPKVQLPITSDYRMARAFARRIDPSLVSVQGTAIGKALEQALLAFSGDTEQSHGRVIILITDGENHEGDAIEMASYAKSLGIEVDVIGVGSLKGAPIPLDARRGDFLKDETGAPVTTALNEAEAREIAKAGGGEYINGSGNKAVDSLVDRLDQIKKSDLRHVTYKASAEQFPVFIWLALFFIIVDTIVLPRKSGWLKKYNFFTKTPNKK